MKITLSKGKETRTVHTINSHNLIAAGWSPVKDDGVPASVSEKVAVVKAAAKAKPKAKAD